MRFLDTTICLITSLSLSARAAERPNIVLILADELGYSDLSSEHPDKLTEPKELWQIWAKHANVRR